METGIETEFRLIDHEHPLYMGMFTDEGNVRVVNMVNRLILQAASGAFQRRDLQTVLRSAMDTLESENCSEIYDTEVRSAIAARINKELCLPMGWIQIDGFFDDIE